MSMFKKEGEGFGFGIRQGGGSAFGGGAKGGLFDKQQAERFAAMDEAIEGESPEDHGKRVLSIAEQSFKARADAEAKRHLDAVDSEYWFAVCFQSREQKEQFLKLAKLFELGDKYLDGWEVAKALGIKIDRVDRRYNISDKLDPKLAALARELPKEGA